MTNQEAVRKLASGQVVYVPRRSTDLLLGALDRYAEEAVVDVQAGPFETRFEPVAVRLSIEGKEWVKQ